ncbi:MAG: TRAP transporter substrate-binding protein [Oscillospiraceae bacterium]
MKKRALALTVILALALTLFAGCGGGGTGSTAGQSGSPAASGGQTDKEQPANQPAADPVTLTLSIGNGVNSDNYYKYNAFCEKVAELSGGSLVIELYPGGTLASDADALTAVMNGDVDFCHLTAGAALKAIKDLAVLEVPGAFGYAGQDDTTSFIEFEAKLHDTVASIFADYGIKYIAFNASAQAVIVCNSKLITTPSDMECLTMRTSGTWLGQMLEGWGAATVSMGIGDLATGLERNTVSGTLTAYGACTGNKLYEVAPYVTFMSQVNGISSLVMNMDTWNSLTAEQQGWLDEAAAHYLQFGQEYMAGYYAEAVAEMEAGGATLYFLTPEEEDAFLVCTDSLYESMAETCTEKGIQLIELVKEWNAEH